MTAGSAPAVSLRTTAPWLLTRTRLFCNALGASATERPPSHWKEVIPGPGHQSAAAHNAARVGVGQAA